MPLLNLNICCNDAKNREGYHFCPRCGNALIDIDGSELKNKLQELQNEFFSFGRVNTKISEISFNGTEMIPEFSPSIIIHSLTLSNNRTIDKNLMNIRLITDESLPSRINNTGTLHIETKLDLSNIKDIDTTARSGNSTSLRCDLSCVLPAHQKRENENLWNRWGLDEEQLSIKLELVSPPKMKIMNLLGKVGAQEAKPEGIIARKFTVANTGGGILGVYMKTTEPWLSIEPVTASIRKEPVSFEYRIDLAKLYEKVELGRYSIFNAFIIARDDRENHELPISMKLYKRKPKNPSLSIDFGTKNTKVAFLSNFKTVPYKFPSTYRKYEDGIEECPIEEAISSKVYIDPNGSCFIAVKAEEQAKKDSKRLSRMVRHIEDIKTHIFYRNINTTKLYIDGIECILENLEETKIPSVYSLEKDDGKLVITYSEEGRLHISEIELEKGSIHFIYYGNVYTPERLAEKFLEKIFLEITSSDLSSQTNGAERLKKKTPQMVELIASVPSFSKSSHYKDAIETLLRDNIGFKDTAIIDEPICSGFYFMQDDQKLHFNDYVLVVDSGGGTTDIALLQFALNVEEDTNIPYKTFKVIATTNNTVAGNHFTSVIAEDLKIKMIREFEESSDIKNTEERKKFFDDMRRNAQLNPDIYEKAERIKTSSPAEKIYTIKYEGKIFNFKGVKEYTPSYIAKIVKTQVSSIIELINSLIGEVERILKAEMPIDKASKNLVFYVSSDSLRDVQLNSGEILEKKIKRVYLSGGTIEFKPLKQALTARFPEKITENKKNDDFSELLTCVSRGAILSRTIKPVFITTHNYGLKENNTFVIIHKNRIPYPTDWENYEMTDMPVKGKLEVGRHQYDEADSDARKAENADSFAYIKYLIDPKDAHSHVVSLLFHLRIVDLDVIECKLEWCSETSPEWREAEITVEYR